jgi:protoporphyrinogen oxidase
MKPASATILGGGLAGMAAAYALASNGWKVTIIEAAPELGGLAGSFVREGRSFPLGYHHILHRDRTLLYFLDVIGALQYVRWRRIRMLFRVGGESFDLTRPLDFMRYPMRAADKAHFVKLMLRAFRKSDWSDWHDRSAADLVDSWASAGVRETMFEPLTQIKFGLPCSEVSGAWLGARMHHREGSAPLGYIPGRNWTEVLCTGLAYQLDQLGVVARTKTRITRVETSKNTVREVETDAGDRIGGDVFISTMATENLRRMIPDEDSTGIRDITYTALTSVICATTQQLVHPEFYWMNLLGTTHTASGLFMLQSLNPTLGTLGESYLNFVTHSHSRAEPFFKQTEEQVVEGYKRDFREVFGEELHARWIQVNRIPMYSPVLVKNFKNPPIASTRFGNLFFAGNYRTFPSVVSTGTAMHSGLEAANAIVNSPSVLEVLDKAQRFSTPAMFLQA